MQEEQRELQVARAIDLIRHGVSEKVQNALLDEFPEIPRPIALTRMGQLIYPGKTYLFEDINGKVWLKVLSIKDKDCVVVDYCGEKRTRWACNALYELC